MLSFLYVSISRASSPTYTPRESNMGNAEPSGQPMVGAQRSLLANDGGSSPLMAEHYLFLSALLFFDPSFLLKLKDSLSLPKSMESEAVPKDQKTDEIVEEKRVINEETDMNGETISHPKEHENEEEKLKMVCSTDVEAVVATEAEEKSREKNESIVEDVKEDPESSNNEMSDSVALSARVVEDEADSQQKAGISVSSERREDESKKQHESDTQELSPGPVEDGEGNAGEILVEEQESEGVKDQVVSDISKVPISETEDKKEEPVLSCTTAESAPKESGEDSQFEEFLVDTHVTGESSKEKISNPNRSEDDMKVENFASESIDMVPDFLESSDGAREIMKETMEERTDSRTIEDMVKEVAVVAGFSEVPAVVNLIEIAAATSAVGSAEETGKPEVGITDDKQEFRDVEEPVMDQVNGAYSSTETVDVSTKEDSSVVSLEMVEDKDDSLENQNEIPLEATYLVKEVAADSEVPKVDAFVDPTESTNATSAIKTIEDTQGPETKIIDDKQEVVTEIDEPEVEEQAMNQANEVDATSETVEVAVKEDKDTVTAEMVEDKDSSLHNLSEAHMEPLAAANTPLSTNGTSSIQAFDEVTQDKLIENEEQLITETSKVDPAGLTAVVSNEIIGDKKDDCLEDETSIEIPTGLDATGEILETPFEGVKDVAMVEEKNDPVEEVADDSDVLVVPAVVHPTESSSTSSTIITTEESREIEAKTIDVKQEAVTEIKEPEVRDPKMNQANEVDATSDTVQVAVKEENDIVTVAIEKDNDLNNLSKAHVVATINPVKEDATDFGMPKPRATANIIHSTNLTSAIQIANEITQPKAEVIKHEKKDKLTEVEELPMTETNKVDSASLTAKVPLEGEKAHASTKKFEDKTDDIFGDNTSTDNPNGVDAPGEISEIHFKEVKGPEEGDVVQEKNDPSQVVAKVKDMDDKSLKDDRETLLETSENIDGGVETADAALDGKRNLEVPEIVDGTKEDNLKNSTELESSPVVALVVGESKVENMESEKTSLTEASGMAEVLSDLDKSSTDKTSEGHEVTQEKGKEAKDYECSIVKESKDESITSKENYAETVRDLDKEANVVAALGATRPMDAEKDKEGAQDEEGTESPQDENLIMTPKCADVIKVEGEAPKQDIPAKPSQRHSNNIISKLKQSLIKAKKIMMGKSPSSKNMSAKSKQEIK
ncbi:hypothetical protein MUK42_25129 [Musa troglodytarum]|uniref:Uncharacterized protein n=1 Tax=Musa troglodytarum TaxID=320322 RepID=A0A9E7EY20_9LILI|nr:hypothetical protein MUK42_25129 [Musa troglodytarum]